MSQPIVTRKKALEERLTFYFTGNPCRFGHIAERYTLSCHCVICQKEDDEKRSKQRYTKRRRSGSLMGAPAMIIGRLNIPQF